MVLKPSRRYGSMWNDMHTLDRIINSQNFNIGAKGERDFENSFSSVLMSRESEFEHDVITQIDKEKAVQSVYCFGKRHRPDLTLGQDGAAIEMKYFRTYTDSFNHAIGQAYMYRLKYKYAVMIFVLSEQNKALYEKIEGKQEKDLEELLQLLADDANIFSYIVPAFKTGNKRKCLSFFSPIVSEEPLLEVR